MCQICRLGLHHQRFSQRDQQILNPTLSVLVMLNPRPRNNDEDFTMITALVQFKLTTPITQDEAQALFEANAPHFHQIPGLIRKYFLRSQTGDTVGGVYLWKSPEDAERFYSDGFIESTIKQFGVKPSITYFETPVIVDNFG